MGATRIYLDHAATSPLRPEVREAMLPWLDAGNASSLYAEGRKARQAIDDARERVAHAMGALFAEVIFTSGGTEAANFAIVGSALANENPTRRKILLGAAEHPCVLETEAVLRRLGYEVDRLPVDRTATVLPFEVGPDVLLVSVMQANNEFGTIQPVEKVAEACRRAGAIFHCDAVQGFGTLPFPDADLVSVSAHKLGGPKGVGALRIRAGIRVAPWARGGGQEREMRAGTENVAALVGFGAAVDPRPDNRAKVRDLFERLLGDRWVRTLPPETLRLPGHAHGRFPGVLAETLLIRLDRAGISASAGSACSSGSLDPSATMLTAGFTEAEAREGLRFTLGHETTPAQAEAAAARILRTVQPH